jgi:competence protein ComEC
MHIKTLFLLLGVVMGMVCGEFSLYGTEIALVSFVLMILQVCLYYVVVRTHIGIMQKEGRPSFFAVTYLSGLFFIGSVFGVLRVQFEEGKNNFTCSKVCSFEGVVIGTPKLQDEYQKIIVRTYLENTYDVEVRSPLYPRFGIGDKVSLVGIPQHIKNIPPKIGDTFFDYISYLQTQNIGSQMYYPKIMLIKDNGERDGYGIKLGKLREYFIGQIQMYVGEPSESLASGMLFGDVSFSKDLIQTFRASGLSHIIVLSGFNISVLISAIIFILAKFPFVVRITFSIFFVLLFVLMVGAEPSIVRATLMSLMALLALFLGRQYAAKQALMISFLCSIMYAPSHLFFDASLHLSFLATAGIIYMSESLQALCKHISSQTYREIVATTLAAYISTLPYIIWSFGLVSPYALLANVLVLPLVPWIMLLTFLVLLISPFSTSLAFLLGYMVTLCSDLVISIAQVTRSLPYASLSVSLSGMGALLVYLGIVFIFLFLSSFKKNETPPTKSSEIISGIISY